MKKIFVDTNILLDLLLKREDYYIPAAEVFSLADKGKVTLHVSSLSFANIFYLLQKINNEASARTALKAIEPLVEILDLNGKIIKLSLNDDEFKDFEDGLQYYSALNSGVDIILTRNLKDFKASKLPVMTAEAYLKV
ncbi:type II toxin-antitoxin system VapC family toxin [Neolewinella agarilytica]|uniref:type II toxin-antitoxin system VapC family toxin n=1 Tax=Neolewinella agarilytica TaxID=478744 RepID=UPI002356CFED|nr:PIN domain-containing protein [Neolewinella agarilytica]